MREIRTLRSNGRELETGPGHTLHGHKAGNGGRGQGDAPDPNKADSLAHWARLFLDIKEKT